MIAARPIARYSTGTRAGGRFRVRSPSPHRSRRPSRDCRIHVAELEVEGSYVDLGSPEADSAGGRYAADVEALDVFAVGMLPLGIADLFVKAGMVSWDVELTSDLAELPDSVSEDGTDPVYGIGFQLRFSSFAVRAEVEYFDIEATNDVYMVSIGGSYTF